MVCLFIKSVLPAIGVLLSLINDLNLNLNSISAIFLGLIHDVITYEDDSVIKSNKPLYFSCGMLPIFLVTNPLIILFINKIDI